MDRRCLIMAEDPELLDAMLRLAAAAGVEVTRAVDGSDARRWWTAAPAVLLDPAAAGLCADAELPRRDGVVVVVRGEPSPEVWRLAVSVGAANVAALPEGEDWLVGLLADAVQRPAPGGRSGAVVSVVGGRGGAGASLLATATAVAAARTGADALLVDCDPLGGGLDLLIGAEQAGGLRWPELTVAGGRVQSAALHSALPRADLASAGHGELAVLSCARSAHGPERSSVSAVLDAGRRGGETVVCDLPRYPTEAALAALGATDLTVLVVPADLRSCAAAGRVAAVLAEHTRTVEIVVRGPSPGGITAREVSRSVGLPVLTFMRAEPGIEGETEHGKLPGAGRGALSDAGHAVLDRLGEVSGSRLRIAS
ncbi:secretion/DNA translocation related CpaE-like protein [Pseudonocardia sediminis]|uniref:Secretion/DNA translocation related CpaE-like protein n=1 Tax=Pseudonocardia sediminis TaxID=1397368 RepID=A0A4Q7UQ02_PSEST|nr:septum site-determining protein Ssd [Pseudonocardia sediminis]RZT83606.1 secretion/DNA translocation related CpaE-like protein [Pseudonocardia sediminis]